MTPTMLPLACTTDALPCNDTSSFDAGLLLVSIAALLAVIVAVLLVRRRRSLIAVFVGVAFIALGVAVAFGPAQTASFGWFSYTPLSSGTFVLPLFGTQGLSGLLLASAGLFALGCGAGGLLTRTRAETKTDA